MQTSGREPSDQGKAHTYFGGRLGTGQGGDIILKSLLLLAVLYTIYFARGILLPMTLALFFAALLQPAVSGLRRLRIPDVAGAAVVVLALIAAVLTAAYTLSGPAAQWINRGPELLRQAEHKLHPVKRTIEEAQQTTKKIEEITELEKTDGQEKVVVEGPSLAGQVVGHARSVAVTGVIVIVLLFFLLAKGRSTLEHLLAEANPGQSRRWFELLTEIRAEISRYLVTAAGINACLGIATAVLMAVLGMPNPVLWGVMAGLLNFVPYLGGAVSLTIFAIVAFLTFETWTRILLPPICFFLLTGLEGQVITPMIMGRNLILNPIMVFVFILFGGWIWGVLGVLLAVPIMAALKIISARMDLRLLSRLIG